MNMKNMMVIGLLATSTVLFTGCTPVKVLDVREIKPNETAWLIPLDGASQGDQAKFNSVEFLNAKKIAAKRVMIDKVSRSIGRMPWDIEWIPASRVITVDRSLVTREFTDNAHSGTSAKNEGIPVNTKDNIALTVGLTITVNINEEDASTYLYYHGEKALSDVTDQNIRSYAVAELNRQVSSMTLVEFQQHQAEIYAMLFKDAVEAFKHKGVTIQYLGNAEGWKFRNESIQESINKSFIAQQDNKTAQMEQEAQRTRNATALLNQENANKIKVMTAQAEVDAATKLENAKEAAQFQNQLQITLIEAQAKMAMATKWNGSMPASILPSNSPLLMNLGTK